MADKTEMLKAPNIEMPSPVHSKNYSAIDMEQYEQRNLNLSDILAEPSAKDSTSLQIDQASLLEKNEERDITPSLNLQQTSQTIQPSPTGYHDDLLQKSKLRRLFAGRNQFFSPYRRLLSLVLLGNLAGMIILLWKSWDEPNFPLSTIITTSAANILAAILVRQEYIVNAFYILCWYIPHSLPLALRADLAKIYEHGGLHSGCAAAGTAWLILLAVTTTIDFVRGTTRSIPALAICFILVFLLSIIVLFAIQTFRFKNHNLFERTHRFGGWLAVALFWVEVVLFILDTARAKQESFAAEMIRTPSFWMLIVITFHIVLPWLRLRKLNFTATVLSSHALRLDFQTRYPPIAGIAISSSPLVEWHPFATFPNPTGGDNCHSIIISHTGDWTRRHIDNPQSQYWLKGLPKIGLLSLAFLFRSVIVVTTGSGIGPCLSLVLTSSTRRERTHCHMIWSTPNPVSTYGSGIYHGVLRADPAATIIDTKIDGRPDLLSLAYAAWKRHSAEAVFVISNRRVTRQIINGLEEIGVPAFGPIWDS
jgi:hypothetical protein